MSDHLRQPEKLTYNIAEAVRVLGISRSTLYKAIAAKELTTFKLWGRTVISRQEIERALARAEAKAANDAIEGR